MKIRIFFAFFTGVFLFVSSCTSDTEPNPEAPDATDADSSDNDGVSDVGDSVNPDADGDTTEEEVIEGNEAYEYCTVNTARTVTKKEGLEPPYSSSNHELTEIYDHYGVKVFEESSLQLGSHYSSSNRTSNLRSGEWLLQRSNTNKGPLRTDYIGSYENGRKQAEYVYFPSAPLPELSQIDLSLFNPPNMDPSLVTYEYESNGSKVSASIDTGIDGFEDILVDFNFDAAGRLESSSIDQEADGSIDEKHTLTYNERDQVLSRLVEYPENASVSDVPTRTEFKYDQNGNLIRESLDEGLDGGADEVSLYDYDEDDRLIRERHDTDGTGSYNDVTIYTYDEDGNLIREEEDEFEGEVITQEFNERGDIVKRTVTRDRYDDPQEVTTFEYDYASDGYTVTELHIGNNDELGPTDLNEEKYEKTSEYDEFGRLLSRETRDQPFQYGTDYQRLEVTNVDYQCEPSTDPLKIIALDAPGMSSETIPPAFSFRCSNMPCTYECKVDSEPFAACEPGVLYEDIALGEHIFSVRATDDDGNISDVATATWTAE